MNDIFKKHFLELLLFFLLFVTIFIRTLKNPHAEDKERSIFMRVLDSLGSVFIGCSVGISIYIGSLYFTNDNYNYIGFLVGYLVGSLGEKLMNVLDLKLADVLMETLRAYLERFKK